MLFIFYLRKYIVEDIKLKHLLTITYAIVTNKL